MFFSRNLTSQPLDNINKIHNINQSCHFFIWHHIPRYEGLKIFGSRHGKNPCDTFGDTVKSLCLRLVASTDVMLNQCIRHARRALKFMRQDHMDMCVFINLENFSLLSHLTLYISLETQDHSRYEVDSSCAIVVSASYFNEKTCLFPLSLP